MNRAKNRLQRAMVLFRSAILEFWRSEEVSGRINRVLDKGRSHPYYIGASRYLNEHVPIWKTLYKESGKFRDRLWHGLLFAVVLIISLYFFLGEDNEAPDFDINANEIHFRAGAPQLAFVRADPVSETLLPVAPPVPARVAMDEARSTPVHPALSGRVVQQHAQLGDRVSAGDPLVTIDSPEYGTALTDWQKADADAKRKKAAYQRARELLAGEAIARRDYEVAEADSKIADAEAKRAYLRIANLVPYGEPAPDSQRLTLRAPIPGIVASVNINPGREIRTDVSEPIAMVSDLSHVWVIVDAPEQNAANIHVGDVMMVSFDNLPNQVFKADVTRISPLLDAQMRRVQIRAEIDNPDLTLRPGMFGRAQLSNPNAPMVVRIPIAALITHGVYASVFVETGPGTFQRKHVEVAYQDHQWIWLKPDSEVKPGDRVVTIGALLLASELSQSAK